MYVCMYVCMYVYIYIYTSTYKYIFIYIIFSEYIYIYIITSYTCTTEVQRLFTGRKPNTARGRNPQAQQQKITRRKEGA